MKYFFDSATSTSLDESQTLSLESLYKMMEKVEKQAITNYRLNSNPILVKTKTLQVRKHKKKRINKKWLKKYGTKTIYTPDPNMYIINDIIVGHPKTLRILEKEIEDNGYKENMERI